MQWGDVECPCTFCPNHGWAKICYCCWYLALRTTYVLLAVRVNLNVGGISNLCVVWIGACCTTWVGNCTDRHSSRLEDSSFWGKRSTHSHNSAGYAAIVNVSIIFGAVPIWGRIRDSKLTRKCNGYGWPCFSRSRIHDDVYVLGRGFKYAIVC